MKLATMIKYPSAFLPLLMSLTALGTVLSHIALFGIARETDEGTTAHIFQLLITAEIPVIAFFTIKWLPKFPRPTLEMLALQFMALIAAFSPVYYFNL